MPVSYVEDITAAWLTARGHLVHRNVWIQQQRSRRSWTDIDVLALKGSTVVICSCKAFTGNATAEITVQRTREWFADIEALLREEDRFRDLMLNASRVVRLFVVDDPGAGWNKMPEHLAKLKGIRALLLKEVFLDFARAIVARWRHLNPTKAGRFWTQDPSISWGKVEDATTRLAMQFLRWDMLNVELEDATPILENTSDARPPAPPVTCSSCGGADDLHLVTMRYEPSEPAGRVLLYCMGCRGKVPQRIEISIPLDLVTPSMFVRLYETGATTSNPQTATAIVFGKGRPDIIQHAAAALARRAASTAP